MSIERRLAALEASLPAPNRITAILRSIVCPGQLDAPPHRITCDGHEWTRCVGESPEQFRHRAVAAALSLPRPAGRLARLLEEPEHA